MKKNKLFITVIILTIFLLGFVYFMTEKTRFNDLVTKEKEWDKIIADRNENEDIMIENISFNDYPLIVDNKNNKLYYSFVDLSNKYNPIVKLDLSENDLKLKVKKELDEKVLKDEKTIEVVLYNDKEYRLYELILTKKPIINMNYDEMTSGTTTGNILVIDNKTNANQKVIRTEASITLVDNNDYLISMRKESIGRNKRKNDISIFGTTMNHEFKLINRTVDNNSSVKHVDLFINNEYVGVYLFDYKD